MGPKVIAIIAYMVMMCLTAGNTASCVFEPGRLITIDIKVFPRVFPCSRHKKKSISRFFKFFKKKFITLYTFSTPPGSPGGLKGQGQLITVQYIVQRRRKFTLADQLKE